MPRQARLDAPSKLHPASQYSKNDLLMSSIPYGLHGMIEIEKRLLKDRRILIPPARPEANPLLHILKRRGASWAEPGKRT